MKTNTIFVVLVVAAMAAVCVAATDDTVASPADSGSEDANGPSRSALAKFLGDGGPLVWFVLLPLSLAAISLIVQFFLLIRRDKLAPGNLADRMEQLAKQGGVQPALAVLEKNDSVLARTLRAALNELNNNSRTVAENAAAEMLEQETTTLLRKIEWLNIIGNVSPMIGLFGTVWGMINAFDLVHAGQEPDQILAGGISVALVTTWWGLIVAIPALAAYGSLRNRVDSLSAEIAVTTENVMRDFDTAGLSGGQN